MLNLNQLIGFGAGGLSSAALSYIGKASTAAAVNPHTFTSQAIGAADATRRVFVTVHTFEAGSGIATPTAVTIAGISATQHVFQEDGSVSVSIWSAAVPTGTTGNIVITMDQTPNDIHIGVFRAINLVNATFHDDAMDDVDPISSIINIPANGILITACSNSSGTLAMTTGGATEVYDDEATDSGYRAAGAFASGLPAQTNRPWSFDGSNGAAAAVALSWA